MSIIVKVQCIGIRAIELKDFSNGTYYLLECEPAGYYIIESETGMNSEYSVTGISPYINATSEKLYYGGPTFFFEEVNGEMRSTYVRDEVLTKVDISMAQESSSQRRTALVEKAERQMANTLAKGVEATVDGVQMVASPRISYPTYVTNYYWLLEAGMGITFEDAAYKQGYVDGNYCGYVAANLMLYYWQRRNPSGLYIHLEWYNQYGLQGSGLTEFLIDCGANIGYGNTTDPFQMSIILQWYQSTQGFSGTFGYSFAGSFGVINGINNDRPSILYGKLWNPEGTQTSTIDHAVLVYGYYDDGALIVNYGWPRQSNVIVEGLLYAGNTYFIP